MESCSGFSCGVGFALCFKGDLNVVCHGNLDWIVALQNSECHSRLLVEQNETVKLLNEKFSSFFLFCKSLCGY